MAKKYTMHVISGTHWDREWRHTAEQSKLRLVDLVDSILNILESDGDYHSFVLDGGAIVLEDYYSIRPENKMRIKKLIEAGRLFIVGWYTLPETYTVASEALIRNLLVGMGMAKEFGGAMKAGYTATSYGQTSQLPQIYKGFGIENAMFYRGTNRHVLPQLFLWEALDGTRIHMHKTFDEVTRTNWYFYVYQPLVLGKPPRDLSYTYKRENIPVHLCDMGLYEKAFRLVLDTAEFSRDENDLKKALNTISKQAMPYAVGNHLLALNMEDNAQPFKQHAEMVSALDEVSPDIRIIQDSLDQYMETVLAEVDDNELHIHRGELRYGIVEPGSWNGLFGVTHSSRVKLKILNETVETNLLHYAEPLAAFAAFYGAEYPVMNLKRAWESLLKNHAHDSIVGCAVDKAHEDMLYNFSIANTVAEEVIARSIISLFGKINSARHFDKNCDHTITMFNTLNIPRKEVVPVVIDLPKDLSLSGGEDSVGVAGGGDAGVLYYDIVDKDGKKIEYVQLSAENIKMGVERQFDTATAFSAVRRRLLLYADVPGVGYATYALRLRGPNLITHPQAAADRPLIARDYGVLENERLKVKINSNGTFSMLYKESGKLLENLHYFTDEGQVGSAHKYVVPQRNPMITSLGNAARIIMEESNQLRGVFRIELKLQIPSAATLDGRDRLHETVELPITCWLTLEKGAKHLKIRTKINNKARDHKLYVNFPTGVKADFAAAESAFAIEKRTIRWEDVGDNAEQFYPFQPMQNFVDVSDGKVGVAFINKGLREYEVRDDAERTISITLLRTQRAYMTANPDMTPEEYEKYTGLHSIGEIEYNYAIYPHMGGWEDGKVLDEAYCFKAGIKALQGVPVDGSLESTASFLDIQPSGKVMISAVKLSENGKGVIVRLWNTTSEKVILDIKTILPLLDAYKVRMDETVLSEIECNDGVIQLEMGPHKIESVQLGYLE